MPSKTRSLRRPKFVPRDWKSPLVFGILSFLALPSATGHGDLAGLIAGLDGGGATWRMSLTPSPAGSVHQAQLMFSDGATGKALPVDAGMVMPDGRKIAFAELDKPASDTPDEDRVTRQYKGRRVMAVEPMQPPKAFSAGSILQRSSSLLEPLEDQTAFVKSDVKEIEVASFFFRKDEANENIGVPTMLADLITNASPDVLASAYAPSEPDYARNSPFDAILGKDPNEGRFVPNIAAEDHAWAANILSPTVFSEKEQQCLSEGIYFEARGESVKGQAAVAQVILNRVRNPAYPDTVCNVVYQNRDWRNRCQFSFACDNIPDRINSPRNWKVAQDVAMAVTAGKIWLPEVGSSTHYHATYVRPNWARTMKKVGRIGLHVFYRTYGGGWS